MNSHRTQNSATSQVVELTNCFGHWRNICYLPAGRSVLETTVPEVSAVLKTEGTVFPNTDRPRPANNVNLLLSSAEYFVSMFLCWIFTAAIFNLGIIKFIFAMIAVVIWIHNCLFLRSLFTFYVLCSENKTAGKDAKAGKLVAVRTRGPDGKIRTAQMHEKIIVLIIIHSKYFPVSDWLKPHA